MIIIAVSAAANARADSQAHTLSAHPPPAISAGEQSCPSKPFVPQHVNCIYGLFIYLLFKTSKNCFRDTIITQLLNVKSYKNRNTQSRNILLVSCRFILFVFYPYPSF
jgi:hypothetical protein